MKTVNLELSRQLKESGYPQEGEFYWMKPYEGRIGYSGKGFVFGKLEKFGLIHLREYISSPTADEILEQLPGASVQTPSPLSKNKKIKVSVVVPDSFPSRLLSQEADTLADAAAKMWLYLKQNNLLEVKG